MCVCVCVCVRSQLACWFGGLGLHSATADRCAAYWDPGTRRSQVSVAPRRWLPTSCTCSPCRLGPVRKSAGRRGVEPAFVLQDLMHGRLAGSRGDGVERNSWRGPSELRQR